jgi:hypothetical protein
MERYETLNSGLFVVELEPVWAGKRIQGFMSL